MRTIERARDRKALVAAAGLPTTSLVSVLAGTLTAIGAVAILLAEFVPVLTLQQLVVIGTLFAFMFVAAGVIVMRRRMPHLDRGFSVPLSPFLPALSLLATLWLLVNLQVLTWVWFALWMAFGLLVYLLYGRRHSLLAAPETLANHARGRHRR